MQYSNKTISKSNPRTIPYRVTGAGMSRPECPDILIYGSKFNNSPGTCPLDARPDQRATTNSIYSLDRKSDAL